MLSALRILCFSMWMAGLAWPCRAAEWPQFRGAASDGISPEKILKEWPVDGPARNWLVPMSDGFCTLSASKGRVLTQVILNIDGQLKDVCLCLNAATGETNWTASLEDSYYPDGQAGAGDGPRSTPTVSGNRVFVLTSWLKLICLDIENGQEVWRVDFRADYAATVIPWQNAASPLVAGDYVYLNANGLTDKLFCLRKSDGSVVWKGQKDKMTQASPVAATILGVPQILFFAQTGLVSVQPETGAVLWRSPFPYSTSTGASPVVGGDIVFCSAGYGGGSTAVRLSLTNDTFVVKPLWRLSSLMSQWMTPVYMDGYLYGLFGYGQNNTAPLKCVEMATGKTIWSQPQFGQGGTIGVDGHILVLSESGELVLVKADPAQYTEVARFKALNGKCWNAPIVSDGHIYARSISEAIALDVSLPAPSPLRMSSALRGPDGVFRLSAVSADGADVDPARATHIFVQATSDLLAPSNQWLGVNGPLTISNGMIHIEDSESTNFQQRFYRIFENP